MQAMVGREDTKRIIPVAVMRRRRIFVLGETLRIRTFVRSLFALRIAAKESPRALPHPNVTNGRLSERCGLRRSPAASAGVLGTPSPEDHDYRLRLWGTYPKALGHEPRYTRRAEPWCSI